MCIYIIYMLMLIIIYYLLLFYFLKSNTLSYYDHVDGVGVPTLPSFSVSSGSRSTRKGPFRVYKSPTANTARTKENTASPIHTRVKGVSELAPFPGAGGRGIERDPRPTPDTHAHTDVHADVHPSTPLSMTHAAGIAQSGIRIEAYLNP
jgi:hypothetical protein